MNMKNLIRSAYKTLGDIKTKDMMEHLEKISQQFIMVFVGCRQKMQKILEEIKTIFVDQKSKA